MSISLLGALIHTDPDEARRRILAALEQAHGDRQAAAALLGTTHRSFYRFLERLKLWEEVDQLVERLGVPKAPGPPRVAKRIRDAVLSSDGNLARAARVLGLEVEALQNRITELDLWADLNRVLKAAGAPKLVKPTAPTTRRSR